MEDIPPVPELPQGRAAVLSETSCLNFRAHFPKDMLTNDAES